VVSTEYCLIQVPNCPVPSTEMSRDISLLTWTSQYSVPGHFVTDLDISVLGTWTFRYWPGHLGTRYLDIVPRCPSQYRNVQVLSTEMSKSVTKCPGTEYWDVQVSNEMSRYRVLIWTSQYSVPGHFVTDLDISVLGTWTFRYWLGHLSTRYWTFRYWLGHLSTRYWTQYRNVQYRVLRCPGQ
jgi:hypothetical protein